MGTTPSSPEDMQEFFAERSRTLRDPAHEAFCRAMVTSKDPTTAWRIAYNKGKKAQPGKRLHELLTDPSIERRMQFLQEMTAEKVTTRVSLQESYIIDGMQNLFERCMQIDRILDRNGVATGEFKFDSSGAGKALDMMAKTAGLYREKRQASDTENQTDEQLLESVRDLSSKLGDISELARKPEGVVEEEDNPLPPVPEAS